MRPDPTDRSLSGSAPMYPTTPQPDYGQSPYDTPAQDVVASPYPVQPQYPMQQPQHALVQPVIAMPVPVVAYTQKDVGIAYLFWLFFGLVGAHQFYLGKTGRGLLYLFTFGVA